MKSVVQQYPSVTGTNNLQDVLRDGDVKAVVLATPVSTHAELGRTVLKAGKSVLVEKPLATSRAEAQELVELASERGLLAMAGHIMLYSPAVQLAKALIEEGAIGTILYAQSSRVNLGIHQSDVSVVWDLAPHDLSILFDWIAEIPEWVSAHGRSSHGVGPADVAFLDIGFPSGCIANVHLSWLAPTKMRRTTVVGSRRMLVFEDMNHEEPIKIYDKGVELPEPQDFGQFRATYRAGDVMSPRVETTEPLRAEIDDFLARVQRREVPDHREETAVSIVATAEAAQRSLEEGGQVIHL